ncbi:MAG: type B 50S ribosomal protein L31 [Cytophagales bacterium]|nr:type B 50S ribosomal protein L31 [Cytophagales bacterium]
MPKDIHPDVRPVVFLDTSCNKSFLILSSVVTTETIKYTDGNEYPLYKIEISSASHPFYTGEKSNFSNLSRVEKFKQKYIKYNNR